MKERQMMRVKRKRRVKGSEIERDSETERTDSDVADGQILPYLPSEDYNIR